MWARSHTSGLISGRVGGLEVRVGERRDQRERALAGLGQVGGRRGCETLVRGGHRRNATQSGSSARDSDARAPGSAPYLDDLAHRRRAPRDARVQRPHDELEAPGLELLELGHQRVEAAALLVDEHDVARADALGGRALGPLGGAGSWA